MNSLIQRGSLRALCIVVVVLACGCTPMSYQQKTNNNDMDEKGYYVKEKSKGGAVALGFLPGGGSFYTGRWGVGIVDLVLWPLSVAWDPVVGYTEARHRNYRASWDHATAIKKQRAAALTREHDDMGMSREVYESEMADLNEEFSFLMSGQP
jgi:hypothetical protein